MNQCDTCAYNGYDEEDGEYYCSASMDEDDCAKLAWNRRDGCPFYRNGDEYQVVRHQAF